MSPSRSIIQQEETKSPRGGLNGIEPNNSGNESPRAIKLSQQTFVNYFPLTYTIFIQDPDYDHGIVRPVELWENSDGCIYLIREIASCENGELKKDMQKYLMQLPELGLLDQF